MKRSWSAMATNPSSSGAAQRYPVPNPMQKASRTEVKTVGEPIRASGKVGSQVYHFRAVEVDGVLVKLEDTALISPGEDEDIEKLHVAIIKDITQDSETRKVTAKVQWLYRPEEAKKEGGSWVKEDSRVLYYSFQYKNIAVESVIHPCIVHFIPWYKGLPDHRKHPGFVVRNLYDVNNKKLVKLTDVTAEDEKRDEIHLLLNKTMKGHGDLSDSSRMKVLPENEGPLKYHTILLKSNALTSDESRNKWLEKILQALERACTEGGNQLTWPDSAVAAAAALEKACNETHQNLSKYNRKLGSLVYNLELNIVLARRFLKQEFGASTLLEMNGFELKEGLTLEDLVRNRREEPQRIRKQITDARCRVCTQRKDGLLSMAGAGYMDHYKLECQVCGRSWYASDPVTSCP